MKALNPKQRLTLAKSLALDGRANRIQRVYIPKPGTSEQRPLGIPTIADRAKQALVKMVLEPEWEALFEPNSYGFRPGRGCHDAIEAIMLSICQTKGGKYVLDADIAKCFDTIDHDALIDKLDTSETIKHQVEAWLKAGIMEDRFRTEMPDKGTPQGGVISPLLANIALHGLETHLKQWMEAWDIKSRTGRNMTKSRKAQELSVIRYADDFVVLHRLPEVIAEAKLEVEKFLAPMGLKLKDSKTRQAHTNGDLGDGIGFDFLGFHVRKYKVGKHSQGKQKLPEKTHIKP